MYFLEHKVRYTMPILGRYSFLVQTWRWQQIAVSEARWPLENLIPYDKRDEYRITSNQPREENSNG